MKKITQSFLLFVFLITPLLSLGQNRQLSGTVVAFDKFPIKNVTIRAKKAKTEIKTDDKGQFTITIAKKDVLQISESVFLDYSQKVSDKDDNLRINLIIRNNDRDMEKAVNEGFIKQEDLNYGLENLWIYNNEFSQFSDTYEAIRYALPESTIIIENGQKGIQLRGPKTVTGQNAALILVNGVIADDVTFVIPSTITSIRKLTSQQASLFGARGGNGVISIETK